VKIYDSKIVVIGIIFFLGVVTVPMWFNGVSGQWSSIPNLVLPSNETQCIMSTEWMREHHPDLLLEWRNAVVREGEITYTAQDGKEYEMSLTGTCLDCHDNKAGFCDTCHNYVGNQIQCFNCHIAPEEIDSANNQERNP
jgi:hypothetical protein